MLGDFQDDGGTGTVLRLVGLGAVCSALLAGCGGSSHSHTATAKTRTTSNGLPSMPAAKPGSKLDAVERLMKQRENWQSYGYASERAALGDLFSTNIRLINYQLGGSHTPIGRLMLRWNLEWMLTEIRQGVHAGRISKSAGAAAIRTAETHTKQDNGKFF